MKYLTVLFALAAVLFVACPRPQAPVRKRPVTMPVFTEAELAAAEPLEVVAATPQGEVERLGEGYEVTVTFSEPMIPLGEVPDSVDFPLLLEPDVAGTCHWLGARSLAFRPDTLLAPATRFRVRIPRGVRAETGAMLKQDFRFEFSTARPVLLHSDPYHEQRMVELDRRVYLYFNVPMDPRRARRHVRLETSDGAGCGFALRRPGPKDALDRWWYDPAEDSARTLVLVPRPQLDIQAGYRVVLEAGLPAREGELGLAEELVVEFRTFNRFRFEQLEDAEAHYPEDRLAFQFSNPVSLRELAANISFRPEVKVPRDLLYQEWATEYPSMMVDLAPETGYEVVLAKWLKDRFGNRLGREVRIPLKTLSYRPRATMPTGPGVVESEFEPRHPVSLVNVESLDVRMRKLARSEVIPFWNRVYDHPWRYEEAEMPYRRDGFFTWSKRWRPGLPRNARTLVPLSLAPALGDAKTGYLFCELDIGNQATGSSSRYRRAFLQVVPYALTAKFSPENGLVYVSRLRNGSPIVNARVELRDDDNRVRWTGRTGDDGFAWLPGWSELGLAPENRWDSPRVWLFADGPWGEAFVHSDWGTGIYPYDFGIDYDWSPDPDEATGFIYTEKGLYRAGDTVHVKGIVRQRRRGSLALPGVRNGRFEVSDPRGEELHAAAVRLSDRGSFDLDIPLPAEAVSGYYSYYLELGENDFYGSFRVEAYRPAEFEVEVVAGREEYVAGDELAATVSGRYLFGAPMSGDRVDWSVSLSPTAFAPPGLRGYTWGPLMDEGVDEYRELATGSGRLDDLGQIEVKTRLEPGRGLRACRANLEATVTAANERGIAGRNSWLVHRSGVYVGVKADRTFAESGDTIGFGVVACDPQGRLMDDVDVRVTVLRRVWKSARKSQTGGRYSWVSEPQDEKVHEFRLKTRGEEASFAYRPARPGMYWLKLEASDRRRNPARTDISFWVYGQGDASWMMRDDDLIELVRDRESYRPGDTALVMVKSPWSRTLAVVTVEREHVLDYFTVGLFGTAEVVRVPVREEYLPNAFVSVMLLKGRTALDKFDETGADLGKPGFKMGYVELPVEPDARKLDVALAGLDEEYRPGDSVSLELKVTDRDGNGRAAEVAVAVVDLGVLKLIGYRTPDPFSVFYAPRPLSVATAELRLHVIGQRNYGEKGEAAASDGLDESGRFAGGRGGESYEFAYRQKFLETARWLPAVRTGSDGRARVGFRLPDNLTTWQVMAVAATTDRFGSGEARFRVNRPLLVLPSLPRFVRPGDEFYAGVMVHNRGEERMAVRVRARVSGGVELRGEPVVEVEVEPNKAQEVRFDYRCTGGDSAGFAFEAVAGEEQDGLKLSLPVRNPPALEAVAVYETTADSLALQWLEAPADALPGVGGLEITLASSGLAELERGVEWLRTYPYECLEQRLSKTLPFVLAEDLINTFKLSELTGARLREFCREQFVMVPKFQDESGGFHFWPNRDHWRQPSPWLSAYTMHVLYEARQAGYDVDPAVVDRGRAYLVNWLARDQADDWPYSTDERLTTRALAVCALGEWGGNVGAHVNTLMERLDQLSVYGKAYLLKAVARDETARSLGHDRRIVQALGNKLKLAPTTAHYEEETEGGWLFHSNVRTTAVVLQALLETQGEVEFADKAVRWLVLERKSGRWRTTQENAMVFDALATYFRVYEKVEPDFSAEVRLAGRQALSGLFRGRSLETRRAFIGLDELARGEKQEVEVRREGSGRLYYGLRLSYAPTGRLEPKDEGLRVEKTIKPADKGRGDGFVRGQQYLVTLRVYTPQERLFVVVDDPLPAGFEVVNTSFETEGRQSGRALDDARRAGDTRRWWGGFDHEEIYDDRYVLFATALEKGWHTRSYLVKALTPGRFLMPVTRAEEMYTPEVFGRTGQDEVIVADNRR